MDKTQKEGNLAAGISVPNIFIYLTILTIICAIGLYALSLTKKYQLSSTEKKLKDVQDELKGMSETDTAAKVASAAVENYDALVSDMNHWSVFLQQLSDSTFISSKLTEVSMQQESGVLNIEGIVRTYEDLSKYIVALRDSEVIDEVTLISANLDTSANVAGIGFVLEALPNASALASEQGEGQFEVPNEQ